ncbi:MAG: FkbM family methyltransferase [Planctomycetes bacterium]|nr:FkbM family methyltransferase [Planctomycetota bacterium]
MANPTIIDVGAHRGDYTAMCLEITPLARIVACEPHPLSCAELRRRFSDRSNISLCETAIAADVVRRTFYDRSGEQGTSHASLHRSVIENLHTCEAAEFEVQATTLDEIATRFSVDDVDLLKIDTEGSELDVLKGAGGLLREHRIAVCQIEFNAMNAYSRVFFKDFWDMLADFHLFRLLPRGLLPITAYNPLYTEIFAYQNIIAVSRHHPERLRILEGL